MLSAKCWPFSSGPNVFTHRYEVKKNMADITDNYMNNILFLKMEYPILEKILHLILFNGFL